METWQLSMGTLNEREIPLFSVLMAGLGYNEEEALRKRLRFAERLQQRALKLNGSIVGMNRLQKQIQGEMAMLVKVEGLESSSVLARLGEGKCVDSCVLSHTHVAYFGSRSGKEPPFEQHQSFALGGSDTRLRTQPPLRGR